MSLAYNNTSYECRDIGYTFAGLSNLISPLAALLPYQPGYKAGRIKQNYGAVHVFWRIPTSKFHHINNHSRFIEPKYRHVLYFGFIIFINSYNKYEAFDFASRIKLPRGPHAARGPRVGKPWVALFCQFKSYVAWFYTYLWQQEKYEYSGCTFNKSIL